MPLAATVTLLAIYQPLYLGGVGVCGLIGFLFFRYFERTVIFLLVLRSSLDVFSDQQVPALFAIGLDALALAYIGYRLLLRQPIQTDRFWWFLMGWVGLQGLWVLLLPLGGLGADTASLGNSVREWVRLLSWGIVYLLVMQLKGRIAPQRLITLLMLAVVLPVAIATLQLLIGNHLPALLQPSAESLEEGGRLAGTLGHYNSFATFNLMFLALSLWKGRQAHYPWPWFILAAILAFLIIATKSLTGLVMLGIFAAVYLAPKLDSRNLLFTLGLVLTIFALLTTGILNDRLGELSATPLFNPDLSWSRAIALQLADIEAYRNSFNWRLAQWSLLLQQWQLHPLLGYGLNTAKAVSPFHNTAHNDYVRALVEGGIVGFNAFLLFLFAQFVYLVKVIRSTRPATPQRSLGVLLLALFISMLVGMLTCNLMVHTTFFFYWWTLLATLTWPWSPPAPEAKASPSRVYPPTDPLFWQSLNQN
jgi:O-antigen ligase